MPAVRTARWALPAALLVVLALPAGAHAAATVSVSGATVTYAAADALGHEVYPYRTTTGRLRVDDPSGVTPGAGCAAVTPETVDCGTASAFTRLVATLGAGDDTFSAEGLPLAVTVDAGDGNDEVDGGTLGDDLDGGAGSDTVYGNGGNDSVSGGAGDDEIGGESGTDILDGGPGNDAVGAWDEAADAAPVRCGTGADTVDYDYDLDVVDNDCETLPPHIVQPPAVLGTTIVGQTLTRTLPVTVAGTPTETYTYWERCTNDGWTCWDIPGAVGDSYTLTAEDRDHRVAVIVYVGNAAGYDGVLSDLTALVDLPGAPPEPSIGLPPARTVPIAMPAPRPFAVARPPAVAVRGAAATVDTGRTVTCPAGGPMCQLDVRARPAGASAKVHGRPKVAGVARVRVKPAASAKVAIRLTPKAARLLRSKGRLTLAVSAVLKRGVAQHAASSFSVTVKAPKRRR